MTDIKLRKIKLADKKYFTSWWRDKSLIRVTSGVKQRISDQEIDKYFKNILKNSKNYHYLITLNDKVIGHISLNKRQNGWCETQIMIGNKINQGKGYGTQAIKLLLKKTKRLKVAKIYLKVRATNKKAISAYIKCGFKKSKNLETFIRMELKI